MALSLACLSLGLEELGRVGRVSHSAVERERERERHPERGRGSERERKRERHPERERK